MQVIKLLALFLIAICFISTFTLADETGKVTLKVSSETWEPSTPVLLSLTFNQDVPLFSTFGFTFQDYEDKTCPFILENVVNGVLSLPTNCYYKNDSSTPIGILSIQGCNDLQDISDISPSVDEPNGSFSFLVYAGLDYTSNGIPANTEIECRLRVPSMMSAMQITKPIKVSPTAFSSMAEPWSVDVVDAVVQVPTAPKAIVTAKREEILNTEDRPLLNNKTFVDNLVVNFKNLSKHMATPIDLYFSTFDPITGDLTGVLNGSSYTTYHQEMNELFLTLTSGSKFVEKTTNGINFQCGQGVRLYIPTQAVVSLAFLGAVPPTRLVLLTGDSPVSDATCRIPLDFQRLLTLQYLDHDDNMNDGIMPLRYGDELNVQVVLRHIGVESNGLSSFGQYTWAGMGHVDARKSTDNKYIMQSYDVEYHTYNPGPSEVGIMVKQNITGFIDTKARYANSTSFAQLHLLNLQNNTWLLDNIKSFTLDVFNSTTLISKNVDIQPLELDLIYNNQTEHLYFEIPWSVVNKLNNNGTVSLDNYIALTLNAEFKTNVTKIAPFALHWKLVQSQSPQRFTTYGTMSTLPRYTVDIGIRALFSEVSNTELTYNFNIIPVFGALDEDFYQNSTITDTFIDNDAIFEHSFVVKMDYNGRELRPLDAPHPKSCDVHTIDEEGQIVEQLKVDFFFDQLYQEFGNNATKGKIAFINPHDSALIKVSGTKLNAKYAIEFSCTQKLHPGPKPALVTIDIDEEDHAERINIYPQVYNKYTKLQGTKVGVVPNWLPDYASTPDEWPQWVVDYSKTGEPYKIAETVEFNANGGEEFDDYVNGMAVYMISNHKIHNHQEKVTFINTAIQKAIEKTQGLFDFTTPLTADDFHSLNDMENGGIAQNDHFDGPALNMKEWLFPTTKPNPNVDLQPRLNALTQDGAIYGYVVRFPEVVGPDEATRLNQLFSSLLSPNGDNNKKNKNMIYNSLSQQQQPSSLITLSLKQQGQEFVEVVNDNESADMVIYMLPSQFKNNTFVQSCPTQQFPFEDPTLNKYSTSCIVPIGEECYSNAQCAFRATFLMGNDGPFLTEKAKCINNRCIEQITKHGFGHDDVVVSNAGISAKTGKKVTAAEATIASFTFEQMAKETQYPTLEMGETLQQAVAQYDYPIDDGHNDDDDDNNNKKNHHTVLIAILIIVGIVLVIGVSVLIYKKVQNKKKNDPMKQGLLY